MAQRQRSLLVDTDIFIDDLNGIQRIRDILDSPQYRMYDAAVTRKELLAKPDSPPRSGVAFGHCS